MYKKTATRLRFIEAISMTSEYPQDGTAQVGCLYDCSLQTAELHGALHLARNRVHNVQPMSCST